MADQPVDPRLIEQTRDQIRKLVAEINQLAASELPPQRFYPEFLNRVVSAVAAVGGALWIKDGQTPPRLQSEVKFRESGLLDDNQSGGHTTLLLKTFEDAMPKLCLPRSQPEGASNGQAGVNTSDQSLIIAPLKVDRHAVGVLEVLLDPNRREAAQKNAVKFVAELCEMGAAYLKNRQLRHMLSQQHLWNQLETFVRQTHSSMRTQEVAYVVANEGKRLVDCDRLSVALVRGKRTPIFAVSGQEVVERKANLIQLMARLASAVVRSGENLLYTGELDESLPPAVRDSLDEFLGESGSKALAVTLLRPADKEGKPVEPIGAIVGEHLEDATIAQNLAPRMDVIAQHATVALANAIEYERIPLLPVWRTVGHAREWMRGRRLVKLCMVVASVLALISCMVFIQWELRLEGSGELAAAQEFRRVIYAPEDGTVSDIKIDDGQLVAKDADVLRLLNPEIERELADLRRERERASLQLVQARRDLATASARSDPNSSATLVIAQQTVESLDRQVGLLAQRYDSLALRMPIDGMIATWDVQLQLGSSRPVKRGDPLLSIANVHAADWILDVRMPEENMGHILAARDRQKDKPLEVWFMAANRPQDQFRGIVKRISSQAEFDRERQEHVQRMTVELQGVRGRPEVVTAEHNGIKKVAHILIRFDDGRELKLSPGAEVKAKVECGQRALGYVLFREVIELVHEVLF